MCLAGLIVRKRLFLLRQCWARLAWAVCPLAACSPLRFATLPCAFVGSGCLSFGSLLATAQRQSASRHRLSCCLSCGSQLIARCLHPDQVLWHTLWKHKGASMNAGAESPTGSLRPRRAPSPALTSLTGQSRGRLLQRALRLRQTGAPYFWR